MDFGESKGTIRQYLTSLPTCRLITLLREGVKKSVVQTVQCAKCSGVLLSLAGLPGAHRL